MDLRDFFIVNLRCRRAANAVESLRMTFKRSPFYGLAYAANDIVLIIMWILASIENPAYIYTVICFVMFFANDIYGFINWQKIKKRQETFHE